MVIIIKVIIKWIFIISPLFWVCKRKFKKIRICNKLVKIVYKVIWNWYVNIRISYLNIYLINGLCKVTKWIKSWSIKCHLRLIWLYKNIRMIWKVPNKLLVKLYRDYKRVYNFILFVIWIFIKIKVWYKKLLKNFWHFWVFFRLHKIF